MWRIGWTNIHTQDKNERFECDLFPWSFEFWWRFLMNGRYNTAQKISNTYIQYIDSSMRGNNSILQDKQNGYKWRHVFWSSNSQTQKTGNGFVLYKNLKLRCHPIVTSITTGLISSRPRTAIDFPKTIPYIFSAACLPLSYTHSLSYTTITYTPYEIQFVAVSSLSLYPRHHRNRIPCIGPSHPRKKLSSPVSAPRSRWLEYMPHESTT